MDELLRHLSLLGRPFPPELRDLYIKIDQGPRDPNQLAKSTVELATEQRKDRDPDEGKNPAANKAPRE